MKKYLSARGVIAPVKLLAMTALGSFFILPQAALADTNITTVVTTPQSLTAINPVLTTSGNGSVEVDTALGDNAVSAVGALGLTNLQVSINSNGPLKGIKASGGVGSAILIGGDNSFSSLDVQVGIVTSDRTDNASVYLNGGGGITSITNGVTISNTGGVNGLAISSVTSANTALTVLNSGVIYTSDGATAVNLSDSNGGSSLTVGNSGLISAGNSGTAIKVNNSGNAVAIANTGVGMITGAISVGANNATIVNNTDTGGLIEGDISSTSGNLSFINAGGGVLGNVSTATGNLNFTNGGGVMAGNVVLGSNADSTAVLNAGNLTGNITMNSATQSTTFGGGALAGDINGVGTVRFNNAVTLGGNIGSTTSVSAIEVAANTAVNASTFNIRSSTASLNSGSTLTLNCGTLTGAVQGATDGVGTLELSQSLTSNGNIGTGANSLALVSVAANRTLNMSVNGNNLDATAVSLNSGSSLIIGAGSFAGAVDGATANSGTVTFNTAGKALSAGTTLGSANGLATLNISGGVPIATNDAIKASTINISNFSSLLVGSNVAVTTDNVNLGILGILILSNGSSVSGAINGTPSGSGTLATSGAGTVTTRGNIGNLAGLASISVGANSTLDAATNNNTIRANGIFVYNNGVLLLGTAAVSGNISGGVNGLGTVSLAQNYIANGNIGVLGNRLAALTLAAGKTLDLFTNNNDVNAANIALGTASVMNVGNGAFNGNVEINGGTLNFTSTSNMMTGNITGNGTSTLGLNGVARNNTGTLTVVANDTVGLTLNNGTSSGSITSTGAASNDANTNLRVAVATNTAGYFNNSSYAIINGGTGSAINAINDSKITINNHGNNKIGLLTFNTEVVGNSLIMRVSKDAENTVTSNASEQNAYNAIDSVGALATGELLALQTFILSDNTTTVEGRQDALQSLTANNIGLNTNAFSSSQESMRTSENRLETLRDSYRMAAIESDSSTYKVVDKSGVKIAVDDSATYASNQRKYGYFRSDTVGSSYAKDNEDLTKGLWIQAFGTTAKQDNKRGFSGYDSHTSGVAIGADTKINKHTAVGLSVSIADSTIKSSDGFKRTGLDSYQINAYAGTICEKYFFDGIAGINFNRYDSKRSIPVAGAVAKANFSGETYSAKIKTGFIERFENNLELIPEVSLTYARNHINDYSEGGAGTLALQVSNRDANFLEGRVGVGLGYNALTYRGTNIYPKIKISYGYDFIGNKQTATSNFVGQSVSFDSESSRINRQSLQLDAGLNVYAMNGITVSANYILEHKTTYESHSGALRLRYDF